jgi:hypothetical protein
MFNMENTKEQRAASADRRPGRPLGLFLTLCVMMNASLSAQDLAGEYSLRGFREVGSGLRLNADHTFEFYYTYGASDRRAVGTWSLDSGSVVLQGSKRKGHDFDLKSRAREGGSGKVIRISDPNTFLQQSVVCFAYTERDTLIEETDSDGIARFAADGIRRIELVHGLFPDEPTAIDCSHDPSSYFEFTLNPSLGEVVFDGVEVKVEGDRLRFRNKYLFSDRLAEFGK